MVKTASPEKRAAILDAATRAFRDEGFETTSMDRIAELAGVSKRTVYNHFGSKETLFQAVVEHLVEGSMAAKQVRWDPARSLEDQLAEFARAKSAVADNPAELALTRVILGVFVSRPGLAADALALEGDDPLQVWLEAARAAGRLQLEDVPRAARLFWAMAAGALFWPAVVQGPMPDEERAAVVDDVVQTFLARFGVGQRRG